MRGVYAASEVDAGTVANLDALNAWSGVYGGTVTAHRGLVVWLSHGGGTVTNRYGLYLGTDGTATNDYGIYQASTAKNYFGGNVGIGTASPDQGKLEVKDGTVCVDTNSDDNATSCIANELDGRLKKNVRDLDYALDTLIQLRPVSFDWRYDDPEVLEHYPLISRFAGQPHSIGLIAQEVQKLVPEAIEQETVGDADVHYLQLDYDKLVPVLIKAVQEQHTEIETLRTQIDLLKQRAGSDN